MTETYKLDCLGENCPVPVVRTKKLLDQLQTGDMVEVHVDNEIAVQNLMKLAGSQQCSCSDRKEEEKHYVVAITVGSRAGSGAGNGEARASEQEAGNGSLDLSEYQNCCPTDASYIVAVAADTMGSGDDALGRILIKGFLYAVSQLERLPEAILFYNGGVMLTTDGSDSLGDLKAMVEQGVRILSCGTCLDFYKRKELLQVGEVTDMYTIVETMEKAGKILRP